MKKGLAVLDNAVSEMTQLLTIDDNRPEGFTIIPASIPNVEFDPFTEEAMIEAGFIPATSNRIPDGFFLLQQDYADYLHGLRVGNLEHPANDGRPWAGESSHVFDMPSLEEAIDAQEQPNTH